MTTTPASPHIPHSFLRSAWMAGTAIALAALSGCASAPPDYSKSIQAWRGQSESALTGTFGFPSKSTDLVGGKKVYHYDFDKCSLDFEVLPTMTISQVHVGGTDPSGCPRKLPGGGTF
jgi:hypothetical protein